MGVGLSNPKRAAPEMDDDIALTRMRVREVHKRTGEKVTNLIENLR